MTAGSTLILTTLLAIACLSAAAGKAAAGPSDTARTKESTPILLPAGSFDSIYAQAGQDRGHGDFDKAIAGYQSCLLLAKRSNDSLRIANSLIGIGIANDQQGRFDDALLYYFKALDLYERIGNKKKTGGTLKNIGNTYRVLKDYPKASLFLQQALQMQLSGKDSASVGNVLNDIGLVYMDQDSASVALPWFSKIVTSYSRYISEEVRSYVLNNLALAQTGTGSYPEALSNYRTSLALMEKRKDQYGIALVLGNIGELHYRTRDYNKALGYHLRNLAIVRDIGSNELLKDSYDNLARTYQGMGNYSKAYEYSIAEMDLKDSIYREQSARSIAEMETRYQSEKKQKEIELLQQNNNLAHIRLRYQQLIKYLLLAGIVIVLLIAGVIYRNYRNKQAVNTELSSINEKLQEANTSKAKLIGIISHDLRGPVSQLFSFLELKKNGRLVEQDHETFDRELTQSADNLLEAMEDLLIWSKSQMESFTLSPEEINAGELLAEIVRLNQPFADAKRITLTTSQNDNLSFTTDPNFIRVVLRNLVGNAIKFTPQGGRIQLSGTAGYGNVLLQVQDNGPGIAQTDLLHIFEWNSIRSDSSGLGLKLAREFTEKLRGQLSVHSQPGQGATFTVRIPV